MIEFDLQETILDYFGDLVYDRLEEAGVSEDRWPKIESVFKSSKWVSGIINLESTEDMPEPVTLQIVRKESNQELEDKLEDNHD